MSASITNQTLAEVELWTNNLPKILDEKVVREKVVRLHLDKLGVEPISVTLHESASPHFVTIYEFA
jgi:hypothetical protein